MKQERSVEIYGKTGWIIGGLIAFFVLLFIPFSGLAFSGRVVLATAVLMAIWWMSEAVPIPATALLPLVIFPAFGVLTSKQASVPYGDHNVFLFLGGFFIARAMERHNLHRRIALNILLAVGTAQRRIVLGFILATAFLSMWISNTASTMIMLPIALAVVDKLGEKGTSFAKSLFLGIAYGASVGGIATLVGTPPNIVLAGQMRNIFPNAPTLTFASWLPIGLPVTILMIPIVLWVLTSVIFKLGGKKHLDKEFLRSERASLGPMSREEKIVLFVFALVVVGWIFRKGLNLGFVSIPGWSGLLGISKYVHDSTVAMFGAMLLFIIPARDGGRVLEWRTAVQIPWGIVLLFGGGFSLASAFGASGLSQWIGNGLAGLGNLSIPVLIIAISTTMTFLTEFTSNTATATLMLPILASAAVGMGTDPRLLMIPATLSDSCAFMLPVATPPNAIVFGSGQLKIKEMMKAGIILNILGVIVVLAVMYFIGIPALGIHIGTMPLWAK